MDTGSISPSCALRKSPSKKRLRVSVQRRAGKIVGLEVTGHAGFATAGKDVVCAAVSALVLTAAHALKQHCKARASIVDDGHAYAIDVPAGGNACAQIVLETTLSGLQAIARSYPVHAVVRVHATGAARKPAEKL